MAQRILVAEDSRTQAERMRFFLEGEGYQVDLAVNGREGLQRVQSARPDLIISDIMMPEMDGYEMCHAIKHDENLQDIPVILLTMLSDQEEIVRAIKVQADYYITKPFDENFLLSRVKSVLKAPVGKKSEGERVLNLLLCTYDNAVQQNRELTRVQSELQTLNEELEKKVKDRTQKLEVQTNELKRAYQELEAAEAHLRNIIISIANGIIVVGSNGNVLFANPAAGVLFDCKAEDLIGKAFDFPLVGGKTTEQEIIRRGGEKVIAEMHVVEVQWEKEKAYLASLRDITERKRTEEQLIQAGKLAALGQLGAGIAHELNQPITTIQGFTQRIMRNCARPVADHADELDLIIKASHRMARIVDNIRLFSRQSDFKAEPIDPLAPLDDALMLINEQLRLHGIEVERPAGDASLPRVMGDQVKLQQVFSNLIMNARDFLDALPKDRPRRLVLGVRAKGDRVVYTVEDNGPGISKQDQARIFDPFFTTKEVGKGTGLGLSISHGIVADHGGEIRYEPVEGGGARFLVSLPIAPIETTEAVEGHERHEQKYAG